MSKKIKKQKTNLELDLTIQKIEIIDLPFEIAHLLATKPKITKNDLVLIKTLCDYAKEIDRMQHLKDLYTIDEIKYIKT